MSDSLAIERKYLIRFSDGGKKLEVSYDLEAKHFAEVLTIRANESDDSTVYVDLADVRWLAHVLAEVANELRDYRPKNTGGSDK